MSVRIYWTANTESDISKYGIYRQVVATGVITKIDEVDHPTVEYTDTDGDSTYRYFVTAIDAAGNESGMAGPVRTATVEGLCYIYDTLAQPSVTGLTVVAGQSIYIKIVDLPSDYLGYYWSGQEITVTTDVNGSWACYVPQGAVVELRIPNFIQDREKKDIPAVASKRWAEIT